MYSESIVEKRSDFYISADTIFLYISGRKNDDSRSSNIRSVLASVSHVLHSDVISARDYKWAVHSGGLSGHILAGNVQQHVQSHNLLLDEYQVRFLLSYSIVKTPVCFFLYNDASRKCVNILIYFNNEGWIFS